jgi:Concanavalin A-like lectin/glucanases superfamily
LARSYMRPRLLTFLTLALLLAGPAAARAATPLYPNLRTLPPRNLRFDRTDVSADSHGDLHNVLRFSNTVYNAGEGPVEIRATINPNLNPPSGPAYQRVYDDQGGFVDIPLSGSTLYYHAVHQHYHFDHWGGYELWTKAGYDAWIASGETQGRPDLVGQKTTSCVEDEEFVSSVFAAIWPAAYPPSRCLPDGNELIREGLSPGWGDTYDYYRFEQWIDLGQGTLADGTYVLRSVADPQNLVYESASKADGAREGQADNSAITTFTISGGQIVDSDSPSGTVTVDHVDRSTSTGAVSLDVLGRDDVSGVRAFKVSNDGSTWKSYANSSYDSIPQTISWDLTDPSTGGSNATGLRTVCVLFQDNSGKWGSQITDTISYDPPPPPPPPASAYGRAVAGDSPVGWWRLGDTSGTTAADQEGHNNGAYAGGATLNQTSLVPTDPNKAVAFNGSSGYVRVPPAVAFNFTNAVSLEAWIKPTSLPAAGVFRSVLTKPESYSLQFNGPRLEFTVIQSGTRRRLQTPSGAIVAGGTYHVVGTYDGTTQRLYVNGAQVASAALTGGASVTTNPISIGSWDGASEFFAGTIDEPAVYGTVLSAAQVRAHYDAASVATLAAPSNLSAAARSTSQVDLGWIDNSTGETGQVLERAASSSFSSPTDVSLATNQQSYSDTGLAAGTTYWYRVKAVSGGTSSAWSSAVQVSTPATASYAATVVADRPASYWHLDETSGTIAGDATVANPGSYEGTPALGQPGLVATDATGTAVGFGGSPTDVRVGQAGSLDLTTNLSLEAFVKPTSLPAGGTVRTIVAKTGAYSLELNGPALELSVMQLGVARRLQAPAGTIVAGRAYHVVGTYDGATERLYVNGAQVASAALSGAADTTINGLRIASSDGTQQFFLGTLDEVAVYPSALTAAQVATHFAAAEQPLGAPSDLSAAPVSSSRIDLAWADNAGAETGEVLQRSADAAFSAPTSISLGANAQSYSDTSLGAGTTYWYRVRAVNAGGGSAWSPAASAATQAAAPPTSYAGVVAADAPVGWWRLGETSGTTAANQAGGANGAYAGGATLNQPSLLATDMVNRAVAFNGSSGRVSVPSSAALQLTNHFSLEAWIKPTSLPASGAFRSVLTKGESYSLQFNGPRMEFTVIQSGTRRRLQAPSGAIAAGGTYHVVGTFDGSAQRLYVNGAQVASVALSGSATTNANALYVGSWDGSSEFFAGTVDEPAVYGVVLSASQVAAHYRAGTTG